MLIAKSKFDRQVGGLRKVAGMEIDDPPCALPEKDGVAMKNAFPPQAEPGAYLWLALARMNCHSNSI